MRRRPTLPIRWPAFIAVLLALLLRAGIPDGYMIGTDAAGAVTLELCPGSTNLVAASHGHARGHGDHGPVHEAPCPFGVLAAPVLPSAPPLLAPPAVAPRPVLATAGLGTDFSPLAAAPPPPATGPPARR